MKKRKMRMMRRNRRDKRIAKVFTDPFIEDVAEPVVGFKYLVDNSKRVGYGPSYRLASHHDYSIWPKEGRGARCNTITDLEISGGHDPKFVPHPRCTCGIYAYNTVHEEVDNSISHHGGVKVRLALGGYVLPFTQGWRASAAKITGIYLPTMDDIMHDMSWEVHYRWRAGHDARFTASEAFDRLKEQRRDIEGYATYYGVELLTKGENG